MPDLHTRPFNMTLRGRRHCRGSPRGGGGVLVPLFPSKIAICSHVPTLSECFRTVIFRILFPCSQKLANVLLFPSIFCQCSLVPQNPWETLIADVKSPVILSRFHVIQKCIQGLFFCLLVFALSELMCLGFSLHSHTAVKKNDSRAKDFLTIHIN